MKKILLFLSCSFTLTSFAQNSLVLATLNNLKTATVTPINNGSILNETTNAGTTTQSKIRIYNTSASTQTYNLIRTDEVLNSGAAAYFCIGSNCFPASTTSLTSGNLLVIPTGTFENNFTVDVDEGSSVGLSTIRYKMFNVNNTNDTLSFKISYNGPTSIKKQLDVIKTIEVYPNPSNSIAFLKISASSYSKSNVKLINSLGSIIYNKSCDLNAGENNVEFSVESLKSGIYFIEVFADNSRTTKKLLIK